MSPELFAKPLLSGMTIYGREHMVDYLQRNAAAMQAGPVSLSGITNAYRPSVVQRDRWMCEDLGIPLVAEDVQ